MLISMFDEFDECLTFKKDTFICNLFEMLKRFGPISVYKFNQIVKFGVDFIKDKSWAQIIEIALSICTLRLRPTFWEAFYWRKSSAQGHRAQKSLWNWPQLVSANTGQPCTVTNIQMPYIFCWPSPSHEKQKNHEK